MSEEYNLREIEDTFQVVGRHASFDYGHRVLNNASPFSLSSCSLSQVTKGKCHALHGHSLLLDVEFSFSSTQKIGYPIDFGEIKRVFLSWIEDSMDHGFIANPADTSIIELSRSEDSKLWIMSLNDMAYCNPTIELISKEMFLGLEILSEVNYPLLKPYKIRAHETPNCYTECYKKSINSTERQNFRKHRYEQIKQYALDKGVLEYDMTKVEASGD